MKSFTNRALVAKKQSTSFAQMANNQSISLSSALRANTPPTKEQTTSRKFLTLSIFFFLSFFCTTNLWGAVTTYTFTSKSWEDSSNGWTSGKDGNALTSNQGVQVTTGVSGANATTQTPFTNISKIEVRYCTNASKGAGSIKIQVGNNTEKTFSVTKPSSGGTTLKTATFNFNPNETGKVKITVQCTANSVYIYSITITTEDVTCTTNPTVSAGSHSNITSTTATVSCPSGITSLGSAGCSITDYGFVYGTSSNPTISNNIKMQVGTTYITTSEPFSKELSGLTANTTYYVRPYATNGKGTAYGTQTSFQTLELTKYTVTWNVNGSVYETTQVTEGSKPTFPATPSSCDATSNTFYGWATAAWSGKINDLVGKTIYTSANAMPAINGNITYYAVFCEGGGSGNGQWVQCESLDDFIDGEYYMFVSPIYDNYYYYVPAVSDVTAAGNFSKAGASVFGVTDVTSITKEQGGWKLIKSNSNWKIQSSNNADIYLYATSENNGLAANYSSNASSTWSVTKHSSQSTFAFKYNNSRYLCTYNTSPYGFRTYTGTGTNGTAYLTVYKLEVASNPINFLTSCTTQPSQLAKPTGLNVTNITSSSATLSWDAVANANGYEIKKGNSLIVSTGATSSNLSGLEPSTEYTYCVYAVADGYTNSEETCVTFTTAPAEKVVNWNVKGTEHQTNFNGQSTAIYQPSGEELTCGEKKFVGWTATKNYENATNAPNDLFTNTLPGGVIESTTFYAVYADTRTTTSITYTWDLVKESTTPALATGDQIVIAAKDYDYALSTTQNTDNRGAVSVTKDGDKITIDNKVQIFTLENGNEEGTFALATGNGYLSGTRRKAGRNYYNQLVTAPSKSANTSWYIGFTEETTPYIYNEVSEKKNGSNYEYPNYYVGFNYNYDWWESEYTYYFEAVRDASTWYDYNPENISIYRRTKHENTTTINSGYTTDCGCSEPQTPLSINDEEVVVNTELDLASLVSTGGTGGRISQYYCSDAAHTTIANGHIFSANALGTYEITATQEANNGACETTATFTITVTCATPSITPTTHSTTINTPVDLKSVIKSTSTMPLSFAYTGKNVYISGTNFTFLAAGTYTINATQAAGGIYCNGSQEITITVTDPCEGKTKPSVTATANETTITVIWDALDDVTTYRIYNNTTGDSDETTSTTYTFSGLNPSTQYSWTVEAVYSNDCTAATSGTTTTSTPVVTYTVNWNVAGSGYNTGTPTTSVIHGKKVSDLPTTPNPAEHSCGDKVFVGWSKSQFVDGTRPTDLFTTVAGSPVITTATTFYAVFADCVTDGGDDTPEDDTQGEWTLVTNVNDLQAGDKIIIACYSKEKAASNLTSAILSVDADVTFSNSGNTLTPSASTLIFTLGGSTGAWTFANSSGQLLGATAVKKLAWDGGTTTWSISISGTEATISNTNNSYGRFLYNVGSPRFTTYTSAASESMLLPQIYKKTGSGSGGGETPEPEEYTVTLSVLGNTSTATTTGEYTLPSTVSGTCAGKTFVGWTTTANLSSSTEPTSDYWAKGTPVAISGDVTLYAVFAEESNEGNGEEQTITLTANDFGLIGSYQYKEATVNGYTFVVNQGYLSSEGYIQMNSDKGEGQLFNSTAIPNITSVTVNVGKSNKTYSIYNDASDETYATDGGFKVVNCTATTTLQCEHDYFTIVVDGAVYFSSIVIKYTSGAGITYSDYSTTCESGGETPDPDPDPEPTGNAYVKVTNASSLKAGDKLLLVNESKAVVAGDITSQYMAKVDATISNNTISELPSGAMVLTLGGTAGAWTLANSEGKFLGATAEKKLAWDGGTTTWSISISNGDATIQNGTSNNGRFLYNVGSPRFTTYKSNVSESMLLPQIYKLTSTPASAPARKVAMKKAAAVRAEKSEMVTRPVVKAPAALAAQECTSYENYTTICCANPITDLKFAAGANSITLYWNTAATSATATLYGDEACETAVATQSGTNGTCTFTGLAKTTTYYAKVTTGDGCTAVLEVSTERPIVSVAEWAATQINIDINTNEPIRVYLENEVTGGSTTGNQATELFFSKYYEATANVKLVAVYNGTVDAINLANYTIKYGKTAWASDYITLKDFGATKGQIQPGEEIILYTMNASDTRDVDIMKCVNEAYPEGTWVQVTTTNNTGKGSLSFGGDKTIALFNGGTMIDIIGGGTTSKPDNSGANTKPAWGDAKGWTCDEGLSIDDGTMIGISTNRCLLVRNNTVTSGENAVAQNKTNFVTLCTEWRGAHVPDDDIDDGVSESCENFAFVGTFDYSDYYVQFEKLGDPQALDTEGRKEDGTYLITIPTTTYPKGLHDLACSNMRISVKSGDGETTLVTQDYKVPIIVDQDIQTDNKIYFQYPQRTNVNEEPNLGDKNENVLTPDICAECDVVIRDGKTLTHVQNGQGQFRNMMVYPNAKMDNKAKQPFNLNTLQMQGQNDAVSYAIIENDGSTIDVGDMVFVKRIDDKYWYNFSLPYDCKVADIVQQNGQSMGKYWVDWGIKEYDGKARQAEGNSAVAGNVGLYWKKVEETATLKAHQGYIIGLFTTEWTNQMKFVYFTPINTNSYRESGDDAKNTTIDGWYTSKTVAARHRGWNFTGSPYISRFGQSTAGQGLNNTSLIMTGYPEPENNDVTEYETYTENVYVTIPSTQGGKYYSHSVASGVQLLPFTAYFVQAADVSGEVDEKRELTYDKRGRAFPASAPARAIATKQRVLVELLVTAPDGQTDNTGVWVDERYTPEYEIAADLGKMYVAGAKPQLYTLAENGEMMAYHALPDACAMNIPLRLYAPKAGDYTLTLNQRVSRLAGAERIELLYNNAVVANMMLQDYTITANRGTVNGYSLSITRRADVSTAIDNITGTAITVIANDGYISVTDIPTDAQVSVYDMLGRLLATQSANGQTVVNIPAVPQGVYNIVVGNNNGHTTIKTVIK